MQRRSCLCWLVFSSLVLASLTASTQEHTAPMELRHNMPFVQVMVNDKGPFTFGIDTGTGGDALVTPALIQQLNLPQAGKAEIGDPTGLHKKEASIVKIQSLQVAGVEFKDLHAVQFQPSSREGQIDGILGFPLFAKHLLTLDYPKQQLRLSAGSLQPDGGKNVIPFTMPDKVPIIQLNVGSQTIEANVDSRGLGLSIPEKVAAGLKFASEPIVLGRGRTVSNEFEIKGAELAGDITVGDYTLTHPFVAIDPVLPLANFGAMALRNFAVTFDQQNQLVRFAAAEKMIVIPPPHRPGTASAPASSMLSNA